MKITNELVAYEAPQVEVIAVEVEKGFAASGDGYGDTEIPGTGA